MSKAPATATLVPAPVWIENTDGYLDYRCDLWIDRADDSGGADLSLRFSFAVDPGDESYLQLIDGGEESDSLTLNAAQVAAFKPRLAAAAEAFANRPDIVRLESALEDAIAHVQALTDARRDGASMVEASVLLEDWAVAAADLLPDPEPDPLQAASDAMLAYDLDDQAWDALPDAARAALIAAVSVPALKAKADAYDRTVAAVKAYDARLSARQRSPEGNDYEELMNRIVPVVV